MAVSFHSVKRKIRDLGKVDVQIKDGPLSSQECVDFINHPDAGGNTFFIGTVRSKTSGKEVLRLEFEAYVPMALKEMSKIAEEVIERWDALAVSVHHRVGKLEIGEVPVVIAVSTPHREAAFAACKYAIDALKETVPIWKKEIYRDGEIWVSAHP